MNIKFSKQAVRIRITREELELLLVGRALVLEVLLPRTHTFRVSVRPHISSAWHLDSDPTGLWLSVPRAELEALAQSLPNKEGIEHALPISNEHNLSVNLQVDLKERRRRSDSAAAPAASG